MELQNAVLKNIIPDIENHDCHYIKKKSKKERFELQAYPSVINNLVGGIGVLFIRALLCEMGINEHHIFRWRMENKFIQYLVLSHYNPGSMPTTISLTDQLKETTGIQGVKALFKAGFFLKATLSERTGFTKNFDRTADFEKIIKNMSFIHSPHNEKWILQKRMSIKNEFRVHTFNNEILFGLTFLISGIDLSFNEPEAFLQKMLKKLPDAILQGSLIAWDIALTVENQYYIIESNFTGFHPEFKYGYQTSGYFQEPIYGPIICAWFNNYVNLKYNLSLNAIEYSLFMGTSFYREYLYYINIFKQKHLKALYKATKDHPIKVMVFMGESSNLPIINLLIHLNKVQFADTYYVIISQKDRNSVENIFIGNPHIIFISENELFTEAQMSAVEQLKYERRKRIACFLADKRLKNQQCLII